MNTCTDMVLLRDVVEGQIEDGIRRREAIGLNADGWEVETVWFRFCGRIFRFLSVTSYGDCAYGLPPTNRTQRITEDDPRPLGRMVFSETAHDRIMEAFSQFPLNVWMVSQ